MQLRLPLGHNYDSAEIEISRPLKDIQTQSESLGLCNGQGKWHLWCLLVRIKKWRLYHKFVNVAVEHRNCTYFDLVI